jgi:hypothetical protein
MYDEWQLTLASWIDFVGPLHFQTKHCHGVGGIKVYILMMNL